MGETEIILLVIGPLLFFFFFRSRLIGSSSKELPPLPPGPYPWPIIGNLFQMGNQPHVRLAQMAQLHGPLISLRLGQRLLIVGSSPVAASEILKTHDHVLSGRDVSRFLLEKEPTVHNMNLVFTSECGDAWRHLRNIYRSELFSTKALACRAELRENKVAEMMQLLGSKEGEDIIIKDVMFVTAMNILGNATLSTDLVDFEGNGIGAGIMDTITRLNLLAGKPLLADLYPKLIPAWDFQGWYKQVMHIINQELGGIWEDSLQIKRSNYASQNNSKPDFIDVLIQKGFTNQHINSVMQELFSAGTLTTSATTEWLISELLKNQEALRKARDEVLNTGKQVIKDLDASHLPYLEACLKETLRLHPPGPLLLPRKATQTCEVMGYTIPKDSQVLVNVWAIGRDPDIWDDPLSFKPERFIMGSNNSSYKVNDFGYLPFGFGRRMCPGEAMANRTILLTVASLILNFDWFLPQNMNPHEINMDDELYIGMQKKQPLHLILKLNHGFNKN